MMVVTAAVQSSCLHSHPGSNISHMPCHAIFPSYCFSTFSTSVSNERHLFLFAVEKGSDADYRQEVEELQDQVESLETQIDKLAKENADLVEQLGRAGGGIAGGVASDAATAAALAKYNKLKERYKVCV